MRKLYFFLRLEAAKFNDVLDALDHQGISNVFLIFFVESLKKCSDGLTEKGGFPNKDNIELLFPFIEA